MPHAAGNVEPHIRQRLRRHENFVQGLILRKGVNHGHVGTRSQNRRAHVGKLNRHIANDHGPRPPALDLRFEMGIGHHRHRRLPGEKTAQRQQPCPTRVIKHPVWASMTYGTRSTRA